MTNLGGLTESFNWYETSLPAAERKKRGHFSTPPQLVEQILDACGYTAQADLSQLRVLDPACGSGNFLGGAARRLQNYAARKSLPQEEEIALVQRNLWGFDPDPVSCFLAEMQLRTLLRSKSKDPVLLHIHQADGLALPWEPCIDLLVTNPPYLAAKNTDLTGYRSTQQRGQTDSYLLFLNLAFQAVRPNGWMGLVLPDPLLARANAAIERLRLLKEFTLHHLWHLAGVFAAEVGAVILIAQKCSPKLTHLVSWKRERWHVHGNGQSPEDGQVMDETFSPLPDSTLPQALFLQQAGAEFRYLLANESYKAESTNSHAAGRNRDLAPITVERLCAYLAETASEHRQLVPLSEFLAISRGEELGRTSLHLTQLQNFHLLDQPAISPSVKRGDNSYSHNQNHLHYDYQAAETFPALRGGVDIHPYTMPMSTWQIARGAIRKPLERYLVPKLLVVKSTDRLQAAIDFQGYVALQTLYLLSPRTKDGGRDLLYYFLALLNSRLLRKYVYVLHTAYKWVQPQIEQSVLASLPVPLVEPARQQEILERARAIVLACSGNTPVVEWKENIYEEQERAICALYDSVLH